MSEVCHLNRSPIIEALVNYQANAARLWNAETLRPAFQKLWPEHTKLQELRPINVEFVEPIGTLPPKVTSHIDGFILRPESDPKVVHQARRNGYSFSRLAPYENWNALISEANQSWEEYKSVLQPEELDSIAIRFINRLLFSIEGFYLPNYFTTPPVPPDGMETWTINRFNYTTNYNIPGSHCSINVTLATEETIPTTDYSFILDIEIGLKESLPAIDVALPDLFEEMHNLKNQVFFNLLTSRALSDYK